MKFHLALKRAGKRILFPDTYGLVSAARSDYGGDTVDSSGRLPREAPNPISVAFESLNFVQLEILILEVHHSNKQSSNLYKQVRSIKVFGCKTRAAAIDGEKKERMW